MQMPGVSIGHCTLYSTCEGPSNQCADWTDWVSEVRVSDSKRENVLDITSPFGRFFVLKNKGRKLLKIFKILQS